MPIPQLKTVDPAKMPLDWSSFEYTSVDGSYRLQDCLSAGAESAVFSAHLLGRPDTGAVVKLRIAQDKALGEKQLAQWRKAASLNHPNVLRILGSGRVEAGQISLIYVAVEPAEEELQATLAQRALETDEAREVIRSVHAALTLLHGQGYAHGAVSPEQIFATADGVKLSADALTSAASPELPVLAEPKYLAPESEGTNLTPAADVWCLGATTYEILTQKIAGEEEREKLTEPFETLVERCLVTDPKRRASLADVVDILSGKALTLEEPKPVPVISEIPAAAVPAPAIPITPPAAVETKPKPVEAVKPPEPPKTESPKTVEMPKPAEPRVIRPEPPKTLYPLAEPRRGAPLWIYAAGLGVLLVAVFLLFRSRPNNDVGASKPAAPKTSELPAAQQRTIEPDRGTGKSSAPRSAKPSPSVSATNRAASKPAATAPTAPPKPAGTTVADPNAWRVVVYTYNRREDAESKAEEINRKHPQLKAEAYTPSGSAPFLVVLGGATDRDGAKRIRQLAVRSGMPKDTYAQNFSK